MFSPKSKNNRANNKSLSSSQASATNGSIGTPSVSSSQTQKNAINNNHDATVEPSANNLNQPLAFTDKPSTTTTNSNPTKSSPKGLSYFSATHFTKIFKNPSQFVHTTFGGHRSSGNEPPPGRRASPPVASAADITVSTCAANKRTSKAIENNQATPKKTCNGGLPNGPKDKTKHQPSSPVILFETVKLNIKSPEKNAITAPPVPIDIAPRVVQKKSTELIKPINQLGQTNWTSTTRNALPATTLDQKFDNRNQRNASQIRPSGDSSPPTSVYGSAKLNLPTTNGGSSLKINGDFTQATSIEATQLSSGLNNNLPQPSSLFGAFDKLPSSIQRTTPLIPPPTKHPVNGPQATCPTDDQYFGRSVAKQKAPGDTFTPNNLNDVLAGNCDTDGVHKDYGYFNSFFLSNGTTADYQPPITTVVSSHIDAINHNGKSKDAAEAETRRRQCSADDDEEEERHEKRQDSKTIVIHSNGCSDLADIKEEESASPEPTNRPGNPFRSYLTKGSPKAALFKSTNNIYQTTNHNNASNNNHHNHQSPTTPTPQSVHLIANHDPLEWLGENDDNEALLGEDDDNDDFEDDLNAKQKITPAAMATLQLFLRQHGNEYIKQFLQVINRFCWVCI